MKLVGWLWNFWLGLSTGIMPQCFILPLPCLVELGQILVFALEGQETGVDELAHFLNMIREDGCISVMRLNRLISNRYGRFSLTKTL